MPKSKQQKKDEVVLLVELLKGMQSAVVSSLTQIKVKDERKVRNELKALGAIYHVVKKNLLQLALKELKLSADFLENLRGTIVLMVAKGDAVNPIKAIAKFAKTHPKFLLHEGFMNENGSVHALSRDQVIALSTVPSREELFVRVVGSVRAPLSGMMNVLQGNMRGLVQVLGAYQKTKQ
ncbi:MAG: 50S ribosomal protein L10 [Patescibacteria group bacterium]